MSDLYCRDLARLFLPADEREAFIDALSQHIQDAIACWFADYEDPVQRRRLIAAWTRTNRAKGEDAV